jgi:hypothetical protein
VARPSVRRGDRVAVKKQFCKNGHDRTLPNAVDKSNHCKECYKGRNTAIPAVVPSKYKAIGNKYQRDPVATLRYEAIVRDLVHHHLSLTDVRIKYGVSEKTVRNARNHVLAEWRAANKEDADTMVTEYNEVISNAYKDLARIEYKVSDGRVVTDPMTGAPLEDISGHEGLYRVINQAIAGKRAILGVDAPKQKITATVNVDKLIRERAERLANWKAEIIEPAAIDPPGVCE